MVLDQVKRGEWPVESADYSSMPSMTKFCKASFQRSMVFTPGSGKSRARKRPERVAQKDFAEVADGERHPR